MNSELQASSKYKINLPDSVAQASMYGSRNSTDNTAI